jgi:hypothetical protein
VTTGAKVARTGARTGAIGVTTGAMIARIGVTTGASRRAQPARRQQQNNPAATRQGRQSLWVWPDDFALYALDRGCAAGFFVLEHNGR